MRNDWNLFCRLSLASLVSAALLTSGASFAAAQSLEDLGISEETAETATPAPEVRQPAQPARPASGPLELSATVQYISEPYLAFEDPGLVIQVPKEGEDIEQGANVALLNDEEIKLRIDVAKYAYQAAKHESDNQVKIEYAVKQAEASRADYLDGVEANNRVSGVVTEMEMRSRKLKWEADTLAIDNSRHELEVARLTAMSKLAELRTSQALLKRTRLISPITGIVTEKVKDVGEYVRAGDSVVRIGQIDRLRVQFNIPLTTLAPVDAYDRPVRVRVLVRVQPETIEEFDGQIQYVDAAMTLSNEYRVWTEIENRRDANGRFLVRPKMEATVLLL